MIFILIHRLYINLVDLLFSSVVGTPHHIRRRRLRQYVAMHQSHIRLVTLDLSIRLIKEFKCLK
jgi:hypothetical protein